MNQRSDIDRVLQIWLGEGPSTMADRVVDVVADRIVAQPQRRSWRLLRRPSMNPLVKLAAAVAAIVVVVVVGYSLLPKPTGVGGPTATPTVGPPSTAPTQSPTATAQTRTLAAGSLAAGTYTTRPFDGSGLATKVTFTLPSGWTGFPNWGLLGPKGTGPSGGIGIGFLTAAGLFSDPCHWDAKGDGSWPQPGDIVVGPAVADLVDALSAHPAYAATPPTDVAVNGYMGKKLDLQLPADVDTTKCDKLAGNPDGAYFVWGTSDRGGNDLYLQGPGQRWQLWILDVAGNRVVMVVDDYATTSDQDRAAAQQIVDSVQFTP